MDDIEFTALNVRMQDLWRTPKSAWTARDNFDSNRFEKAWKLREPESQTKKPGGGGDTLSLTDRLKKLVSPGGVKAQSDHIFKDGKKACMHFNTKGGCSAKNCQFSHHCVACEDTAHGIAGHE
eukprot:COSAG01_NODE_419_length_17278_cov_34.763432_5_plen_123_part_00